MLLTVLSLHHRLSGTRLKLLHALTKIENLFFLSLLVVAVEKRRRDGVFQKPFADDRFLLVCLVGWMLLTVILVLPKGQLVVQCTH